MSHVVLTGFFGHGNLTYNSSLLKKNVRKYELLLIFITLTCHRFYNAVFKNILLISNKYS